jgi:nitrate reductase assembly molybdenum cofactor insertion protein NarJ
MDASEALRLQAAVGYGLEDTQMIIESMAQVCLEHAAQYWAAVVHAIRIICVFA